MVGHTLHHVFLEAGFVSQITLIAPAAIEKHFVIEKHLDVREQG